MREWWTAQLDYVFCVYGLAFILLAVTCRCLSAQGDRRLPWSWLALFGGLHGLNEWLDMLAISLGNPSAFRWGRLIVMAVSFIPLFEFGRRGLQLQRSRFLGNWAILPLLVLAGCGGFAGTQGLEVSWRYFVGLPGGWLAGWLLIREASRAEARLRRYLQAAGVALLVYAFASGLFVPHAGFFPARWPSQDTFFAVTGLPVQIVRACCAITCTLSLYLAYLRTGQHQDRSQRLSPWIMSGAIAMLATAGWCITDRQGRAADRHIRDGLLYQATALAATIVPEQLEGLSFSPADRATPPYQRLRSQMVAYQPLTRCRGIWSSGLHNGVLAFGAESYLEPDPLASPVGTTYREPPREHLEVFQTGKGCTAGPYPDEYGTFVTAIAPVCDQRSGKVLMTVCLDLEAKVWTARINRARLVPILLALLLVMILVGGSLLLQHRGRASAAGHYRLRYAEAYIAGAFGAALTATAALAAHNAETQANNETFQQLARAQVGDITRECP